MRIYADIEENVKDLDFAKDWADRGLKSDRIWGRKIRIMRRGRGRKPGDGERCLMGCEGRISLLID